jgi:hypothetical protein
MQSHKRRILLSGFAILTLSLLAGIAVSFYQWDRGSPFDTSTWADGFNPIGRAVYPLILLVMFFPITVVFILVLLVPVFIGFKKEKLWPVSLIGFLAMGVLWVLFLTELWTMD